MPDRKYISLQEASKNVPFDSNYLGLLIRKGWLFGVKKKGRWYTTEEAIEQYMENSARVKVSHKKSELKLKTKSFWAHLGLSGILGSLFFIALLFFGTVVNAFFFEEGKQDTLQNSTEQTWSTDGKLPVIVSENGQVSSKIARK